MSPIPGRGVGGDTGAGPRVNLGFLRSSLRLQYQCQQLWDCLYTDAGVLDGNCLAAALRAWNWVFFSPLVAHIVCVCVCGALRAGMWETVVIKVFCNSIKDSSLAALLEESLSIWAFGAPAAWGGVWWWWGLHENLKGKEVYEMEKRQWSGINGELLFHGGLPACVATTQRWDTH